MDTAMIQKRLKIVEDLEQELRKLKDTYDESLEGDAGYQKVQEEITKVKDESKEKQEKILASTSYKAILDEMKEKRIELKEAKEVLSQELVDYYRASGEPKIEDADGNVKRMKFSVRLVAD